MRQNYSSNQGNNNNNNNGGNNNYRRMRPRNQQQYSRGRQGQEVVSINKVYDSSGPEIKIRGTASHIYEKYLSLARDAHTMGDRIMAENYLQHAEHYLRLINQIQEQLQSLCQGMNDTLAKEATEEAIAPAIGQNSQEERKREYKENNIPSQAEGDQSSGSHYRRRKRSSYNHNENLSKVDNASGQNEEILQDLYGIRSEQIREVKSVVPAQDNPEKQQDAQSQTQQRRSYYGRRRKHTNESQAEQQDKSAFEKKSDSE